jgi:hypothetical protein
LAKEFEARREEFQEGGGVIIRWWQENEGIEEEKDVPKRGDEVSWSGWRWCDSWVVVEAWIQAKRRSRKEKYSSLAEDGRERQMLPWCWGGWRSKWWSQWRESIQLFGSVVGKEARMR